MPPCRREDDPRLGSTPHKGLSGFKGFEARQGFWDFCPPPLPQCYIKLLGGTLLVMWPCSDEEPAQCLDRTGDGADPMQDLQVPRHSL